MDGDRWNQIGAGVLHVCFVQHRACLQAWRRSAIEAQLYWKSNHVQCLRSCLVLCLQQVKIRGLCSGLSCQCNNSFLSTLHDQTAACQLVCYCLAAEYGKNELIFRQSHGCRLHTVSTPSTAINTTQSCITINVTAVLDKCRTRFASVISHDTPVLVRVTMNTADQVPFAHSVASRSNSCQMSLCGGLAILGPSSCLGVPPEACSSSSRKKSRSPAFISSRAVGSAGGQA